MKRGTLTDILSSVIPTNIFCLKFKYSQYSLHYLILFIMASVCNNFLSNWKTYVVLSLKFDWKPLILTYQSFAYS